MRQLTWSQPRPGSKMPPRAGLARGQVGSSGKPRLEGEERPAEGSEVDTGEAGSREEEATEDEVCGVQGLRALNPAEQRGLGAGENQDCALRRWPESWEERSLCRWEMKISRARASRAPVPGWFPGTAGSDRWARRRL